MKKIVYVLILQFVFAGIYAAVFPVAVGMKYGYVDENLNPCSEPIYDNATDFVDGIAVVQLDGSFYIIDESFSLICEINADYAGTPSCGHICFSKDGISFYTDYNGNFLIGGFEGINDFSENYAIVKGNGIFYVLTQDNKLLQIDAVISYTSSFRNGLVCAITPQRKVGFINTDGDVVIDFVFQRTSDRGVASFSSDLCHVLSDNRIGKYYLTGYIDKTGTYKIEPQYYDATSFLNNLACVMYDYEQNADKTIYKWKVIDTENNTVRFFPDGVFIQNYFDNGICIYSENGKKGYISINGNRLTDPVFTDCFVFKNGYSQAVLNGENVLVDKMGNIYYVRELFKMEKLVPAKSYG